LADASSNRPPGPTQEQIDEVGRRFLTTTEMVAEARRKLHPHSWDFVAGGSETEATLARNRLALDLWALRPRVLRDVLQESVDPSSSLLGIKLRIPVIFAPVGGMTMLDPHGALGPVRAAGQFGAMTFISSVTEPDIDIAASAADGRLVLQLYIRGDADWVDAYVERAAKAGCRAICFTVDTDAYSRRERNQLNRFFQGTPLITGGRTGVMENTGREHQERFNWKDIERVRRKFNLPVIVKGIATAEDAKIAVEHGVAVVYVSNHGGRQLDHGQGTLEILPEVVAAANGHAEVMVDGGFVRGTDVLKAVALGAKAVGMGKLQAWALAAGGEAGMIRLLGLLEEEITKDMMLMGLTKLAQVDRNVLAPARPYTWPTALSAFPHLDRYR
jgi:isopentenyl diphosphate isomerase/L-lactate dehydrogenase-like FMN-dependent dehydrogenase